MTVNLPKTNQTGKAEWADVEDNDVALKAAIETLQTEVAAVAGITWYTPKAIATEESRTNTAFGTLTTADEIKSVVVPENGLMLIGYTARAKATGSATGRLALFLGANQLKATSLSKQEVSTSITPETLLRFTTSGGGLVSSDDGADGSTGQIVGSTTAGDGGFVVVSAAAASYDISVQFKATSGSVTAKERKLWVAVFG